MNEHIAGAESVGRFDGTTRAWVVEAIRKIEAEGNRGSDTQLHTFPLPALWNVDLYLKDESVHPTGSVKHRLARSLFLYALVSGWIREGTTIVEASWGPTAVSEAYFARLLDLPFIAVMPADTSPEKIALIEFEGGKCHLVDDPHAVYAEARRLAEATAGHFMDQFSYAERAADWRGTNIAESIFRQLSEERHPEPTWIVVGAATGATSATIGRYLRYRRSSTGLAVVDPEGSAYFPAWLEGDWSLTTVGSRLEGIGRPRVEYSFLPTVIDRMLRVPDAASIAAMRFVREVTGRHVGASTGTNVWGAFTVISEMLAAGEQGSVVTLICDGGERYSHTYDNDDWLAEQGIDISPYLSALRQFART